MRILLVQTCRPAQLCFIARRLRDRFPDSRLEALADGRPANRRCLTDASEFDAVHYWRRGELPQAYDKVVFPLVSRGYSGMKALVRRFDRPAGCGYDGRLRPIGALGMLKKTLRPEQGGSDFAEFQAAYPVPPLAQKVVVVEGSPGLAEASKRRWRRHLPANADVESLAHGSLPAQWRHARQGAFEGAVCFLTSEPGHQLRTLLPLALGVKRTLLVESGREIELEGWMDWAGYLARRVLFGGGAAEVVPRLLLVQTESVDYTAAAVRRLRASDAYSGHEIVVLCRHQDRSTLERRLPECRFLSRPGKSLFTGLGLWRDARRLAPHVGCAIFTGHPVFRKFKLLFLTLNLRRRVAVNAQLGHYSLNLSTWPRIFRREHPIFAQEPGRFLLVQTDDDPTTAEVLKKLADPKLAGDSKVDVFCSHQKKSFFRRFERTGRIWTYRKGDFRGNLRSFLRMQRKRSDVAVAIFSGRPTYRLSKLVFFLLRTRHRLVFNASLECYYLTPSTWRYLFRRQSVAERARDFGHRMLFIQTEDDRMSLEALDRLHGPQIAPIAYLAVYCREDKAGLFESRPEVAEVFTYRKGAPVNELKKLYRARKKEFDCLAAVLSGRSVYRRHKLLFLFAPVRMRLVFNENLDCFYFSWRRPQDLFSLHGNRHQPFAVWIWRRALKAVTALPRFLYLVIWVTGMKLRRAYILASKEAPERESG